MKITHTFAGMLMLVAMGTASYAQEGAKAQQPSEEEKAWMAYATPGIPHEMMAKSVGSWTEEITMWMGPGAPATKSTSSCTNRMIMGGRYLEGNSRGNFEGMPFEGTSLTAYDNAKKMYIGTWIDNMGTGIMITEGNFNQDTQTLEMKGKCVDPLTSKDMAMRNTLKFIDNNTQYMEMFMTTAEGKEYKSMEIKMTRKAEMPAKTK